MTVVDQKRIAKNTAFLYGRMILVTLISLYTSRVVLSALGDIDYGIYAAVGGVVTMIGFLNATLATACQRFFSYELESENLSTLRKTFSLCLFIMLCLTILIIVVCETLGLWYLNNKMDFAGRIYQARYVFHLSLFSFLFILARVPYQGMIVAKEKMKVFAYISVVEAVGNLIIAIILANLKADLLISFAWMMFVLNAIITILLQIYCRHCYAECKIVLDIDWLKTKQVFKFTGWEMIGSLATLCKNQGVHLILNPFFGPIANAARGMAIKVYYVFNQIHENLYMATKPQIIKSYACGEIKEMRTLLYQSIRFSYYLLFIVAVPLLMETDFVLDLWLDDVPVNTSLFTKLLIVNALVDVFSSPLACTIQATGNNKWYQICMGTTLLLILPFGYIGFKFFHFHAESVFYISIILSFCAQIVRTIFVNRQINMPYGEFLCQCVSRIVVVSLVSLIVPLLFQYFVDSNIWWLSLTDILITVLWTCVVVWILGMTPSERRHSMNVFKNAIKK